jgi:hypothetical protein
LKISKKIDPPAICCNCGETAIVGLAKDRQCPSCGYGLSNSDWKKPPMETALFLLQKEYLKTFSSSVLGEMYILLKQYAIGKIKKLVNGRINLTSDILDERASDSATLFIEMYLRSKEFQVHTSFSGFLSYKIQEVLYGYKVKINDELESLQTLTGSTNTDWLIGTTNHSFKISNDPHSYSAELLGFDLTQGVMGIVSDAGDTLRTELSRSTSILTLLSLYLYVRNRGNEKAVNKYNDLLRLWDYKDITDALLVDVMRFIRRH